eukprot:1156865-Pelagomonas_calceolata.AAC.6
MEELRGRGGATFAWMAMNLGSARDKQARPRKKLQIPDFEEYEGIGLHVDGPVPRVGQGRASQGLQKIINTSKQTFKGCGDNPLGGGPGT